VREHVAALREVGVEGGGAGADTAGVRLVKRPTDMEGLRGLVLPGGESTTLSMLLESTGLFDSIAAALFDGLPVLGTCAGLVLLSTRILDGRPDQRTFALLDAVVRRNGYGRQRASFEGEVTFGEGPPLPAVFIRAPLVVSVGDDVEVLGELAGEDGGPVLIRQGNVLASAFHPELTPDRRVHQLFVGMCGGGAG
jgi:5'-phosphate synthase pdxT subunit